MGSTSSEDLTVAMAPVVVRITTSITRICSRWGNRINSSTRVRDSNNTQCLYQDKPKIRQATRRSTQLSSRPLASLAQGLTRKWYTRLKSPNLTKLEGPLQTTLICRLLSQKNLKVLTSRSSKCQCNLSSQTQFR